MNKLTIMIVAAAVAMCSSQVMAQCSDCATGSMQAYGTPVYSNSMYSTAAYSAPVYNQMYNTSYAYGSPVVNNCGYATTCDSRSTYRRGCGNRAPRVRQNCCQQVSYCAPVRNSCCGTASGCNSCCGTASGCNSCCGGNMYGGQVISGCGDCAGGMTMGIVAPQGTIIEGGVIQDAPAPAGDAGDATPVPDATTTPVEGGVDTPPPTPDDT